MSTDKPIDETQPIAPTPRAGSVQDTAPLESARSTPDAPTEQLASGLPAKSGPARSGSAKSGSAKSVPVAESAASAPAAPVQAASAQSASLPAAPAAPVHAAPVHAPAVPAAAAPATASLPREPLANELFASRPHATEPQDVSESSPNPQGPAAKPARPTLRVGTVVWGLVLAVIGAGIIAVAAGAQFDLQLAFIGLLALGGIGLLAGSIATSARHRNR